MESAANVRVRDYIIKNIREQILSGGFPAGMRLAQEELAEGLCVSRIPVREALQILEEQGLVKRLPSRHMVVVEITQRQFHQIFQTIGGLEYRYGRFILESGTKEGFLEALARWDDGSGDGRNSADGEGRGDGRGEISFHRLFSDWLDNSCLSRQFNSMLDIYVEYACTLPDADGKSLGSGAFSALGQPPAPGKSPEPRRSAGALMQVRAAYLRGADQEIPGLLERYYTILEEQVQGERMRHICRA